MQKQCWTVSSGLARLRGRVLTRTMLAHTMLTHTVFACVLHLCAVAGPAAAQPSLLLRALGPAAASQPAYRETAQGARARRLARGACGHSRK